MVAGESREVCSRPVDRDVGGCRMVFSQRRRRSQDSRAANCEDDRGGNGREIVEIVCSYVSDHYSYFSIVFCIILFLLASNGREGRRDGV